MTKLVGILNYNADSFSDGGKYNNLRDAKYRIDELFIEGADIVDIGASATSYGAPLISESEELARLKPLLEEISPKNISIDSYHYTTMKYAVDKGITYINDVNGGKDPKVLELVAENHNLNYICMKSIVLPADKKMRIESTSEIYDWVGKKIEECEKYGIQKERLIIDPGLGFTTNSNQSMDILKNVKDLKEYGIKICIGHSRKSFFEAIQEYEVYDKDIDTLTASLYLLFHEIDYVRIHNVKMHKRSFIIFSSLLNRID
jgi:dihydropteroate synthase